MPPEELIDVSKYPADTEVPFFAKMSCARSAARHVGDHTRRPRSARLPN
jgi:hypothetical protein